ncbi:MAG: L-threonylcarbamoyladenylate synthase [Chitinophagales bacterium]
MILKLHNENPDRRKIEMAVECLKKGGVIIYPTDTIYTFGCELGNKKAMERIAQIKGKNLKQSHFSIICHDLSHISEYTNNLNNATFKLMKQYLPGPYTFILNASKKVPKLYDFKKKTIGIRVPDNNIARALVLALGSPLIATSVHHEDDDILDYITEPEDIYEKYKNQVDIMLDGGIGDNTASTIIDATNSEPFVVREGKGVL